LQVKQKQQNEAPPSLEQQFNARRTELCEEKAARISELRDRIASLRAERQGLQADFRAAHARNDLAGAGRISAQVERTERVLTMALADIAAADAEQVDLHPELQTMSALMHSQGEQAARAELVAVAADLNRMLTPELRVAAARICALSHQFLVPAPAVAAAIAAYH
jgi:hypothetical protein